MPGNMHELACPGCHRIHRDLKTGVGSCLDHGRPWHYEQTACSSCGSLWSQRSSHCCFEPAPHCGRCGGELRPWAGRVWFEHPPGAIEPQERFEGPCPGCGT